jgi:hypothetical protein
VFNSSSYRGPLDEVERRLNQNIGGSVFAPDNRDPAPDHNHIRGDGIETDLSDSALRVERQSDGDMG